MRSRAASRQRLLAAAAEVLGKGGFTAATTNEIAARAGVAVGTLYLHFGDKEGIARAVALEALADLRARLRAAVERAHATIADAARAHAAALVDFVADPRARGRLLFAVDAPGLRNDVLDEMASLQKAHLLERGRDGYFRTDVHAGAAAQALVGMQSRTLMWWLEDPRRATRLEIIDTLARLRLSGIHDGARGAARGRARRKATQAAKRRRSRP